MKKHLYLTLLSSSFLTISACTHRQQALADFSVHLAYGSNKVYINDTTQTFTRAIAFAGDTTVRISFSQSQLDSIYGELVDINYYALPASITAICTEKVVPRGSQTILTIHENKSTKKIIYNDDCHRYDLNDTMAKNLRHVIAVIVHMTERKPAVKSLPESGFISM